LSLIWFPQRQWHDFLAVRRLVYGDRHLPEDERYILVGSIVVITGIGALAAYLIADDRHKAKEKRERPSKKNQE
jgi:hypothetical protein